MNPVLEQATLKLKSDVDEAVKADSTLQRHQAILDLLYPAFQDILVTDYQQAFYLVRANTFFTCTANTHSYDLINPTSAIGYNDSDFFRIRPATHCRLGENTAYMAEELHIRGMPLVVISWFTSNPTQQAILHNPIVLIKVHADTKEDLQNPRNLHQANNTQQMEHLKQQ